VIRDILVALDGSVRAQEVLEASVEIAEKFGATLHPFRAIFVPPEFPAAAAGSGPDFLPDHLVEEALAALTALVAKAGGARVSQPIVRLGQPWRTILAAARELSADLIVVGSHGYHGVDRLLGTNAARVANMAECNVLVVHRPTPSGELTSPRPNGV
jgi:nucleotide-binding universal stress UspA family protein